MVDHLFIFEGQGKVRDILGNYTDFRKIQQAERREFQQEEKISTPEKEATREGQPKRKLSFKEKEELNNLENELTELEVQKISLSRELSSGKLSGTELIQKGALLGVVVSDIEEKTNRWLFLAEFL